MTTLKIVVLSADTELGRETTRQLTEKEYQVVGIGSNAESTELLRQNGATFARADLTNATELNFFAFL